MGKDTFKEIDLGLQALYEEINAGRVRWRKVPPVKKWTKTKRDLLIRAIKLLSLDELGSIEDTFYDLFQKREKAARG